MKPMKPMEPMSPIEPMPPMALPQHDGWPEGLGSPSSSGRQDGLAYAFFRERHRLVVERQGQVTQYDAGEHVISGISQSRRNDDAEDPRFTSQFGEVDLRMLTRVP